MAYTRVPNFKHMYNKKNSREKGGLGEDLACSYLEKHGYFINERNYLRKWGEIDIISIKDEIFHFIEVKSAFVNKDNSTKEYRPEENVHELKVKRLKRVIQTYLNENGYGHDKEFKFHILIVYIDKMTGESSVKILENIIL